MTAQITNHHSEAVLRLLQQFRGKPKLEAMLGIVTHQIQQLEDAFWELMTERQLTTAIGAQLDIIGAILGQSRVVDETTTLTDDNDYRAMLGIKILVNTSNGTMDEILEIAGELLGHQDIVLTEYYPASAEIEIRQLITDFEQLLYRFLGQSIPTAVNLIVRTLTSSLATTLTFVEFFSALTVGAVATDTSLTVTSASAFPSSGDLILDAGLAVQEVVTYTSHTGTVFTLSTPVANTHSIGASVSFHVAADGDDKSLGDSSSAPAGGTFASATLAKGWV